MLILLTYAVVMIQNIITQKWHIRKILYRLVKGIQNRRFQWCCLVLQYNYIVYSYSAVKVNWPIVEGGNCTRSR